MIELQQVSGRFDRRGDGAALSDVSLTIPRGQMVSIVGFIFQFFNLLPTLTCLENVGLPLHLLGWPRKKVARAEELLDHARIGRDILALLHDVHERLGSTVVIVTDDAHVASTCARTVTTRDGRVIEDITR